MAADDLATQGARASAAMVLEYCSFLVSAPVGLIINTLRPEKNMTTRGRQHFQLQYYDYICLERYRYSSFDSNFPPILSRRSCCWEVSFGSGNGLMLSGIKPLPVPVLTSVGNSHRSASRRPTTLEEDRELFVDFSPILCLWFEIHAMRTYNYPKLWCHKVSLSHNDT